MLQLMEEDIAEVFFWTIGNQAKWKVNARMKDLGDRRGS